MLWQKSEAKQKTDYCAKEGEEEELTARVNNEDSGHPAWAATITHDNNGMSLIQQNSTSVANSTVEPKIM